MDDDVLHDVEAGGAEDDGLLGGNAQKLAGELARRRDALETAVIGAVDALVGEVRRGAQEVEHGAGDVHLRGRRFAARHVELKPACLDLGDLGLEIHKGIGQFGIAHLLVLRLHVGPFLGGVRVREPQESSCAAAMCNHAALLRNSIRGLPAVWRTPHDA